MPKVLARINIKKIKEICFTHMGREKNHFTDALAILASMTKMDYEIKVQPF